jgi:hypothetical protein
VLADGRRIHVPPSPTGPAADPPIAAPEPPAVMPHPLPPGRPLGERFGARSGDKGGNANVGLWATTDEDYVWLASWLTAERLGALLPEAAGLEIRRFELPNIRALNFVIVGLLGEGVASTTAFDAQAKGLGEYVRSRLVP